jgi:osmoprotectant transport system substrate-binding protein
MKTNPRKSRSMLLALVLAFALLSAAALAGCGTTGSGGGYNPLPNEEQPPMASGETTEPAASATPPGASGSLSENLPDGASAAGAIRIGTKAFTESLILGELYALAIEDKCGLAVKRKFSLAGTTIHQSLTSDEIDIYPEYTGTALLSVLKLPLETDPQKVYDTVKKQYKDRFGLVWLDYSSASDGQGIAVTRAVSDEYGIKTISDLQKHAKNIRFISQGEFDARTDGIPALEKAYGPLEWKSLTVVDNALKYRTLKSGAGDATPAYTTEGNLADNDFVLLDDDKHVWPPYNIAPVVREETLAEHPRIAEVLNRVAALIDTQTIAGLNAKVDINGREYAEVAKEFYASIAGAV